MRALFVYPDMCTDSGRFQQGIASILAVLKEAGQQTSLLHLERELPKAELMRRIDEVKPGLVAFSTTTHQYPFVQRYSRWVKESFHLPVVCGGIHPTLSPEETIADEGMDAICVGEGEYPMLELVERLQAGDDISDIPNLWVKMDGAIRRNPVRPLIQDLDRLPFPDREVFSYERILKKFGHTADIMTGRGCPFGCTYCCNHALKQLYTGKGRFIRRCSVLRILDEIEQVITRYQVTSLNFDDDTFTLQPKWLEEFCREYPKRFRLPFSCNARVETVNKNSLAALKRAGCFQIQIGIESGSEWLREKVLRRRMSNKKLMEVFSAAKEVGLQTYSFNMVGLPEETPEMAEETFRINADIDPDIVQASVFYPYPGTDLYRMCEERGYLTGDQKYGYFGEGTVLRLPTLSEQQIRHYYRRYHEISFEKNLRRQYPHAYVGYKLAKKVVGRRLTYSLARQAQKVVARIMNLARGR
ncbi:MAG: B12-binding domain-containing radical SAM protein [Dehalococcoidia bacterium]